MQVRASALRGYVRWLERTRKFDAVLSRVPPTTARLMRDPPLPSTWILRDDVAPILYAVDELGGYPAVRQMSRDMLSETVLPTLRPVVSAVLRLFGTSPETLFRRYPDVLRTSMTGIRTNYTPATANSGTFELQYLLNHEVPICSFVFFMASLEIALELCGVRGTVSDPERLGPARVVYHIKW
jgi:hypothetical protein